MTADLLPIAEDLPLSSVPWRDPHTVSPTQLSEYIAALKNACEVHPRSADLRTCLGIAHAMNYDVYKSMDTLEEATQIDPGHFFAQLKYAELFYRLRALARAEEETSKALDLAQDSWQMSLARKQLLDIRQMARKGNLRPAMLKPLAIPALLFAAIAVVLSLTALIR